MSSGHRRALLSWLSLLLLAAVEIGGSLIHSDRSLRPLLLLPALAMVALVGVMFMRVQHSIAPARGFALAGLLWLLLLLGLGAMDPLTRAVYIDGPQTTATAK
jgi:hypothetical protein